MPRIRTVKPDFWLDKKLATGLTRDERLFYIGLWNHADDQGRFHANARMLLGLIFPHDMDLTANDIEAYLQSLTRLSRVVIYEVNEERYGWIPRFNEHQVINKPSKSRIPPYDKDLALFPTNVTEGYGSTTGTEVEKEREKEEEREILDGLWSVFLEELGGASPQPRLTTERKKKLSALYREQLQQEQDAYASFRDVLLTVKQSEFHMSNRKYQMPESLFRNAERRDNWVTESKSSQNKSFADDELRRITGA